MVVMLPPFRSLHPVKTGLLRPLINSLNVPSFLAFLLCCICKLRIFIGKAMVPSGPVETWKAIFKTSIYGDDAVSIIAMNKMGSVISFASLLRTPRC